MKWIPLCFVGFDLLVLVYVFGFFFYNSFWGEPIMRLRARYWGVLVGIGLVIVLLLVRFQYIIIKEMP